MYGVSKITSQPYVMLVTFPAAEYSARSAANHLDAFAQNGVVVDMICQSAPRGTRFDLSFTTCGDAFAAVMQVITKLAPDKQQAPLISRGYSKLNLFGEEMVTSCGVAARALSALADENIEVALITTSDLDISLLVREENEDVALSALHKAFCVD